MKIDPATGRPRAIALVLLLLTCGCGRSLPPAADPAQARQVLESSLAAWKGGGTPDQLAAQDPPVRVIDQDWAKGLKLVDYQIDGEGQPLGLNLQCSVTLNLEDPSGKAAPKKVVYLVGTSEPVVVSRQDADF